MGSSVVAVKKSILRLLTDLHVFSLPPLPEYEKVFFFNVVFLCICDPRWRLKSWADLFIFGIHKSLSAIGQCSCEYENSYLLV
jgi:hypothetical protein